MEGLFWPNMAPPAATNQEGIFKRLSSPEKINNGEIGGLIDSIVEYVQRSTDKERCQRVHDIYVALAQHYDISSVNSDPEAPLQRIIDPDTYFQNCHQFATRTLSYACLRADVEKAFGREATENLNDYGNHKGPCLQCLDLVIMSPANPWHWPI